MKNVHIVIWYLLKPADAAESVHALIFLISRWVFLMTTPEERWLTAWTVYGENLVKPLNYKFACINFGIITL